MNEKGQYMIPAVLNGQTLIDDIEASRPLRGEADIWWLGQSGFVVKTMHALLHFDPYLSDSLTRKYATTDNPHIRMMEIPVQPALIGHARYVFASHTHTDHFDAETLAPMLAASSAARLILPAAIRQRVTEIGLAADRALPMRGEDTITVEGDGGAAVRITAIPSAHPGLDHTDDHGYPFLGFVVQVDDVTIYHSGDTVLYDDLAARLAHFPIDIAFLPINGSKARLKDKIAPNMSAADAVNLAQRNRFRLAVPHHYDMFTFNTVDVNDFADRARSAGIPYAVLRPGARHTFIPG